MGVVKQPLWNVKQPNSFSTYNDYLKRVEKEVFNFYKMYNVSHRKKFTVEFKVRAVELAKKSEMPIAGTARKLG